MRHRRLLWLIVLVGALCAASAGSAAARNPFRGRAMWIWYLGDADGGNLRDIGLTIHRYHLNTVVIKAGDGTSAWSQFSRHTVSTLHSHGVRVCAWVYLYGNDPAGEARVSAAAVHDGADCLLLDAEGEYEGKYVQAQTYIRALRSRIGGGYPVGLAGLPYVDFHPAFPYSVFLGPGGAQYDAPQMYWAEIGVSVGAVYSHTFTYNEVYGRPIEPLGSIDLNPPTSQIVAFREASRNYGADGVSWWEWSAATPPIWRAFSAPLGSGPAPAQTMPVLRRGAAGDLVVWAQEHLYRAGDHLTIDGGYGPKMVTAVRRFQAAHGLSVDGVIGPVTWQALLSYSPARVTWTSKGARASATAPGTLVMGVPKSARLPAKRYEIPRDLGAH